MDGTVSVFAEGGDPVRLVVRQGGQEERVLLDTLLTPGAGRTERVPIRLEAVEGAGPIAVTASVTMPGDVYPVDDQRTRVVDVDPAEGRLVLVFVDSRLGAPFPPPGPGSGHRAPHRGIHADRRGPVPALPESPGLSLLEDVVVAVDDARLAVIHELPTGASPELEAAAGRSPRVLRFAAGVGGGVQGGEWYLTPELTASPVAGELAGHGSGGSAPSHLPSGGPREPGIRVLEVQRGGSGEPVPALTLAERGGRREATVWASGFWRWGFQRR